MKAIRARLLLVAIAVVIAGAVAAILASVHRPFPPDTVPEGAYMRIARDVAADDPKASFPYLEQEAQWACYTIRDMRAKAAARIAKSYPEDKRAALLAEHRAIAEAPDGSDVFAILYRRRRWDKRLRRDLSGAVGVDIEGDRASVVTAHGTRWPFRRRENGIWGITIFTAELLAEAEKATRDLAIVEAAADDYDRAAKP